jgi:hypothetical protein
METKMKRYSAYLKALLRHKYYVFVEGRKLGLGILRLLIHDWDKFGYKMFRSYAHSFYTEKGEKQYSPDADFADVWNRHQKINKHHWHAHLLSWDSGGEEPRRMKEPDLLEMVADWRGAGRAYSKPDQKWKPSETISWYEKNREKMRLHPETRRRVEEVLGYRDPTPNGSSDITLPSLRDH